MHLRCAADPGRPVDPDCPVASEPASAQALRLTGERTVPGVAEENYWYARHEAAYRAALAYCDGATVLDAGCGEGYGAALLATRAARVLAVDCDRTAVDHAGATYPTVAIVLADLASLPLRTGTVDTLVSLQVLEHLPDQHAFLAECRRALRPGGRVVLATPNRLTFTPDSETPLNPFHTREFSPAELEALLRSAGVLVESVRGLRHGPRLRALDERYGGSIIDAQLEVVYGYAPGQAPWPAGLLADVAGVRPEDFALSCQELPGGELGGGELDSCLDLLAVARNPGADR